MQLLTRARFGRRSGLSIGRLLLLGCARGERGGRQREPEGEGNHPGHFKPPKRQRQGQVFPRTILCPVTGAEFTLREFFDDALPVALTGGFAVKRAIERRLDADFQEDAYHLHLKREAQRVEFSDRPLREDLVAAIEADQVLDLLRRREIPPAGRQIGNSRHVREGDNSAVLGADAELALSFEWRA